MAESVLERPTKSPVMDRKTYDLFSLMTAALENVLLHHGKQMTKEDCRSRWEIVNEADRLLNRAVVVDGEEAQKIALVPEVRDALGELLPWVEERSQPGDRWAALCVRTMKEKIEA